MFDLVTLIKAVGYLGIFGIVFAESGLLIGFFLPGDSLLFTAGFLASGGYLDINILIALIFVGAVLGDNTGYAFGHKMGPRVFKSEESVFFHKKHLTQAENFFKKHGGKTLILARFIPAIRTFAPILAGVGQMSYRIFFLYNVVGAALWSIGVTLAGFYLGRLIPDVDHYLLPIVGGIVFVSILPGLWQVIKIRRSKRRSSEG